jgi:hypothetical protein
MQMGRAPAGGLAGAAHPGPMLGRLEHVFFMVDKKEISF